MSYFRNQGESNGHPGGSLPRELAVFLLVVVILWAISLIDVFHQFGAIGPSRFLLLIYGAPQGDLLCCEDNFRALHTVSFFTQGFVWNYPAPCVFIYRLFYLFWPTGQGSNAVVAVYFATAVLPIIGCCILLENALHRRGLTRTWAIFVVVATAILSWPIYYSLHRGNIESLLWVWLALAVLLYVRRQGMPAAILIGILTAFKIYPIIFFALFLRPRRYREIAAGLAAGLVTTIGSLLYLGPTLKGAAWYTLRGIHYFVQSFSSHYTLWGLRVDHSAFILVKLLSATHPQSLPAYLPLYELFIGVIALVCFFARTWKMPRPNQVLMLTAAMVVLPATSFDYTLQSLYIPWAWLALLIVSAHRAGKRVPGAMPAMLCFAVLLAPEMFLEFGGRSLAGPLKALTLIALIGISMIYSFPEEDRNPGEAAA